MIKRILYYTTSTIIGAVMGLLTAKYLHEEHFADPYICMAVFAVIAIIFIIIGHFLIPKDGVTEFKEEEKTDNEIDIRAKLHGIWGWLSPSEGPLKSGYHLSKDRIVIGRDVKCDILINEEAVSRQHAEILKTETGYLIKDIDSKNGIYVNNQRTTEQYLSDGDSIGIGSKSFKLKIYEEINPIPKEFEFTEDDLATSIGTFDTIVYRPEEENEGDS